MRRHLIPTRGDEVSPRSPFYPRGKTRRRLVLPSHHSFSFLASSPRAGRRKPVGEESPGEPGKSRYVDCPLSGGTGHLTPYQAIQSLYRAVMVEIQSLLTCTNL
ncbi:hypothetical protein BHE74_00022246 [Ensete ventricosum]|nr:hypothetical protein BHE74_00022246 [Ensete ventricosum]RZS05711.1 hypothetical protein BHM03_00036248 [Ensete ventricosum]